MYYHAISAEDRIDPKNISAS